MKYIFMAFITTLASCSYNKHLPKHISRMVASEEHEIPVCRIEQKKFAVYLFNVYSNDTLMNDGIGFEEAVEQIKNLTEMGQCSPADPAPRCQLIATPHSSNSDLKTKNYTIFSGKDSKTSIKFLNMLIEVGLCEGKPIKIEELPEEAKKPVEAKKKDENIVVIGGRKYRVEAFWGEKTDYSRSWFSPCGSAQAEAKEAALGICMASGFPKANCKVTEIVTLDKGSAFFSLNRDIKSFCSKRVHVEGKVQVE